MQEIEYTTQFYINGYSIGVFGSAPPDRVLLRLFQKNSLVTVSKPLVETMQLGHIDNPNRYLENVERIEFVSSVSNIIDRFSILGFSLKQAIKDFEYSKDLIIERLSKHEFLERISPSFPDQDAFESRLHELEFIRKINFSDLITSTSEIINGRLRRIIEINGNLKKSIIPREISNPLTRHLVCHGFGIFPFQNKLSLLRILLESAKKVSIVEYEFSGKNVTIDSLCQYYDMLFNPSEINSKYGLKTLIATEGKTDSRCIKESLNKLFPHLTDLYFFIDFELKEGSTKSLIQIVRSLAASGIPNKIIALFDNDTEGIESINTMSNVNFPENIKILRYPDIELAKSYPVKHIDPKLDITLENVNEKGCSIEMYLGIDVLTGPEGQLYSLNKTSKNDQYNFGKLKRTLQQKFEEKLHKPKEEGNWQEMLLVLNMIFSQ